MPKYLIQYYFVYELRSLNFRFEQCLYNMLYNITNKFYDLSIFLKFLKIFSKINHSNINFFVLNLAKDNENNLNKKYIPKIDI